MLPPSTTVCAPTHVLGHGDAGLPQLVTPVDAHEERHEARLVVFLLLQGALLHAESVADVVKLELLAVLLPHALLHEFVPIQIGKGTGRDDELIPQRLYVVVSGLLCEVEAVELQSVAQKGMNYCTKMQNGNGASPCLAIV